MKLRSIAAPSVLSALCTVTGVLTPREAVAQHGNFAGIGQAPGAGMRSVAPAARPMVQSRTPGFSSGRSFSNFSGGARAPSPFRPMGNGGTGWPCATGSGLTINGAYSSDHWKVKFHLGSPGINCFPSVPVTGVVGGACYDPCYNPCYTTCYPSYGYGYWPTFGYGYYGSYYKGYDAFGYTGMYDSRLVNQYPQPTAPDPNADAEPAEPPKPIDIALFMMYAGDAGKAIDEFRKHLKENPDDAPVMRMLAVALIQDKKFDDAVAVMRMAYRTDPLLASQKIDPAVLSLSEGELRGLVTRAVSFGHRAKSASAWLTVAVLMQAEGRETQALAIVGRAERAGLETEIVTPLKTELQ